jgi:hypothetical protein
MPLENGQRKRVLAKETAICISDGNGLLFVRRPSVV